MKIVVIVVLVVLGNNLFAQNETIPRPNDSLSYNPNKDTLSQGNMGSGDAARYGYMKADSISFYKTNDTTRNVVTPPTFNGASQEEGKIALDIWVDENGNVVKVRFKESKSTSGSAKLIDLSTKAAYSMKYDKKSGSGIQYVGYQIFAFTMN